MPYVTDANKELTLQLYANPMLLQDKVLSLFENHVFDKRQVLDGNNVFTFGLEMEATMISSIVNEMTGAFESLYPERAKTMNDLYRHMSDYDFVGVYATPAMATICLMLDRDWVVLNAKPLNDGSGTSRIRIPAHSKFFLGEYQFGIYYPINIEVRKKYLENGNIDLTNTLISCTWDTSIKNPLHTLTSNIIEHRITNSRTITYLGLVIPIYQFTNNVIKSDLISSTGFIQRYDYFDQFYAARVFHWLNNSWNELPISLSDVVYNQDIATAKVKVLTDLAQVEVSIPQVYFSSGLVGNKIMTMLYTTKGNLTVDLRGYAQDQYSASFLVNDDVVDHEYSDMLKRIPTVFVTPISSNISGGRGQYGVAAIKNRIINSAGSDDVLVTTAQLKEYLSELGFECTKYIDNITDRIWLAKRDIKDSQGNTVASALYKTLLSHDTFDNVDAYDCVKKLKDETSFMIMPNAVFKWDEDTDCMKLLSTADKKKLLNRSLSDRIDELNNHTYMATPFHVKISTDDKFPLATAYQLFKPTIDKITFVKSNTQTSTQISIYGINVVHLDDGLGGFKVSIILYKTNDLYEVVPAVATPKLKRNLTAILRVKNQAGVYCYIEGKYDGKNDAGYDILSFTLNTDYDIDESGYIGTDSMALVSASTVLDNNYNKIPLVGTWDILFFVRKDYIPDTTAHNIAVPGLPRIIADQDMVFVAQQSAEITFGEPIAALRNNIYVTAAGQVYKTYPTTTFATYGSDVYRRWDNQESSFDDQLLTDTDWIKIQTETHSDNPTEYMGNPIIEKDGKHYIRIQFSIGDIWYNFMSLEMELLHESGDLILSSSDGNKSLKTPAMHINTANVDGTHTDEILYQDVDTPAAEPGVRSKFVPYYKKYDKLTGTYEKEYTGTSSVVVRDYLETIIDYIDGHEYDTPADITRQFVQDGETYKFTNIPDTFVFVKESSSDTSSIPPYKIVINSDSLRDELTEYKYKLMEFNESSSVEDLAYDYFSELTVDNNIIRHSVEKIEYGCLYVLDLDAVNYPYNNDIDDDDLLGFYTDYDANKQLTSDLLEKYHLTVEVAESLLKLRFPWKKICYAGHFWCVRDYHRRRSLMNFNSSLIINRSVGLAAIGHLQELLGDPDEVKRFDTIVESLEYLDNVENNEEFVWVQNYDPNADASYSDNNLDIDGNFTPLINIGDVKHGALLLNDLHHPNRHFVVVTGENVEECFNTIRSINSRSGSCYVREVYEDPTVDNLVVKEVYVAPINEDIDLTKNSDYDCTNWPWEMENWMSANGTAGPFDNVLMELSYDTYAKIVHKQGDVMLTSSGRPAVEGVGGRGLDYTIELIMYDYKPFMQTSSLADDYAEFVRDLVYTYCQSVNLTRDRLLERTHIYYAPVRTFGLGDFKAQNGDIFTHNLEITVGLKLHVPISVIRDNATKDIIRNNILSMIKAHLETGNFNMVDVANEIKETMSDNIYYVDIEGIDGDPDLQTLVSVDKDICRPYLKQRLVLDTNNAVIVEDALNLEYAALI